MEVAAGKNNRVIVCIYEALGTGFLLFAICMQGMSPFGKFGVAFMIFALILISGPITGAHFNPALTLSVLICNKHWKEDWLFAIQIMLAQFVGAIWGVCLAWLCLFNSNGEDVTRAQIPEVHVVTLRTGPGVSDWDAFQIETICTCVFLLLILSVKTSRTRPTK